ncbi:MAG: DUF4347 domain-containing protein, partial [Leptolyngbyaceae cyanobacterium bins.59]|nr:DUF4347 domain-containing protein [Leptolyngbyaceae cyanobacterium bins.59]
MSVSPQLAELAMKFPNSVLFVDANVPNYEDLIQNIDSETQVVILDANRDGIEQITEALRELQEVKSLQILSHGNEGQLSLGNTLLNTETLPLYQTQLKSWRDALAEHADILLFGCNVAAGSGQAFVQQLSEMIGVDVAASDDLTGSAAAGGDWDLEVTTGEIDTASVLNSQQTQLYDSVLATYRVTTTSPTGSGSISEAINNAANQFGMDVIDLRGISGRILLESPLPTLGSGNDLIFIGNNDTIIDGQFSSQILSINNATALFEGITFANGLARGGDGRSGAGGGLGAGGALFINNGQVMVQNVTFSNNQAVGGNSFQRDAQGREVRGGQTRIGSLNGQSGGVGGRFNTTGSFQFSGGTAGTGGIGAGSKGGSGGDGDFGGGGGSGGGGGGDDDYGNGGNGGRGGFGAGGGGGGGGGQDFDRPSIRGNDLPEHGAGGSGGSGGTYGGAGQGGGDGFLSDITFGTGGNGGQVGRGGGGAGLGGAIFARLGSGLTILNSNFTGNSVQGGVGFQPGLAYGFGVAVQTDSGTIDLGNGNANTEIYRNGTRLSMTLPIISIEAVEASETKKSARFKFNVNGSLPASGIDVYYFVSRTSGAVEGRDFSRSSGKVPLTASGQVIDLVNIADDLDIDPGETLTVRLMSGPEYRRDESQSEATVTIEDNEPQISIRNAKTGAEGGAAGGFELVLDRPVSQKVTVQFNVTSISGDAQPNDYTFSGTFDVEPGQSEIIQVPFPVVDDDRYEGDEKVRISLAGGIGYTINPSQRDVEILLQDDEPRISLEKLTDGSEDKGKNAEFKLVFDRVKNAKEFTLRFNLPDAITKPRSDLNEYLKRTGSETFRGDYPDTPKGSDYLIYWRYVDHSNNKQYLTGNTLVVKSKDGQGDKAIVIGVEPIDDDVAENNETVTIELAVTGNNDQGYQVNLDRKSAVATIVDNEPTLELVAVREAQEYGKLLPGDDSDLIGYVELKLDRPIFSPLGLWVKYTITAGSNVIQGVDYLNSQYRKVSLQADSQQPGIIIPQIEALSTVAGSQVDPSKIRIYFTALPDAIKEDAENIQIDIQPYHFDLDLTGARVSNYRLKQNGQIVDKISTQVAIKDSGLYQPEVLILDENGQLVTPGNPLNPLVARNGKATFKVKLRSQPTEDVSIQFNPSGSVTLDRTVITFKGNQLGTQAVQIAESSGEINSNNQAAQAIAITSTNFTFDGAINSSPSATDVDL